jgi:hypothetical protein
MVNKKGFLRIIEASVAVVIIMGLLFVYSTRGAGIAQDPDWSQKAREILEEASRDPAVRNEIIAYQPSSGFPPTFIFDAFVSARIPGHLNHEIRICDMEQVCGMRNYVSGNVYVGERVFSASITAHSPRKVRIFIWE